MLLTTISIPLQAYNLNEGEAFFSSITNLNLTIMLLCTLSALSVYYIHRSLRLLIPLNLLCVLLNNWWVGHVGFHFSSSQTFLASCGFLLLCGVLLEKTMLTLLLNPNKKWWHTSKRIQTNLPIAIQRTRGEAFIKTSFDISETGLFLKIINASEFEQFAIGEKVKVCLYFNKLLKIRVEGVIVRKNQNMGKYPSGIGLRFENTSPELKSAIRNLDTASKAANTLAA